MKELEIFLMATPVNLFLFAAFVICMLLMSYNYTKGKRKIIFFGDSITEFGTRRGGYVTLLKEMLKHFAFDEKYEVIAAGVSGNTVTDLLQRLDKDVLLSDPYIVVIFIGINDVWHKPSGGGTNEQEFYDCYKQMLEKILEARSKIIICTPAVIGEKTDFTNDQDDELDKYVNIVRQLAQEYEVPLVDLRQAFLTYNIANNIENKEAGILTTDGVHLNERGNMLVAEEIFKILRLIM